MYEIQNDMVAVGLICAAPGLVWADGLKYTYVQGGYETWTGTDSYGGIFMDGSYRFGKMFYVAGSLAGLSNSWSDISRFSARGGYIHSLSDTMDIYAEAGMVRSGFSIKGACETFSNGSTFCESAYSDSSTDPMVEGGGRMLLTPQVELRAALQHITGDYEETFITAGAAYHFVPEASAVMNLSRMLEAEEFQVQIGFRYAF